MRTETNSNFHREMEIWGARSTDGGGIGMGYVMFCLVVGIITPCLYDFKLTNRNLINSYSTTLNF